MWFFPRWMIGGCLVPAVLSIYAPAGAADGILMARVATDAALALPGPNPSAPAWCSLSPQLFEKSWQHAGATVDSARLPDPALPGVAGDCRRAFRIRTPAGKVVRGLAEFTRTPEGGIRAAYTFTPEADVTLDSLFVGTSFPLEQILGGTWTADGRSGTIPADLGEPILFAGQVSAFELRLASGEQLRVNFPAPAQILLQDDRRWVPAVSLRLGGPADHKPLYAKGQPVRIEFTVAGPGPLSVVADMPVTMAAGPDWIPFAPELDIEPGSALDFSTQGFHDAPAGKHGRVIATPAGHFAFADSPAMPRRFYGVNLCFTAQYLEHAEADRLADRLQRLGYNAVRIHHYDGGLVEGQRDSVTLNPKRLDQLDYLLAALIKRGLYLTTDLFVSRPVSRKELGLPGTGALPPDDFKALVPVNAAVRANWNTFTRNLLTHRNPYTGRTYAEEPALAWIALINEGNLGNFVRTFHTMPDWKRAWNQWLRQRYGASPQRLVAAWGNIADAAYKDWPPTDAFTLPDNLDDATPQARDFLLFLAATERGMVLDMKRFLRDDLGCRTLVSNASSWVNHATDQAARAAYDYVDDHFYVDHPEFLERPWNLPSRCANADPVANGAPGGRYTSFTRVPGKPFTITEFNYSAPGCYRAAGGLMAGALAAVQDWDGIWRFAYSHSRERMFTPGPMGYFDLAADPLGQAGDRAALCLFLRGDLPAAKTALAVLVPPVESAPPPLSVPKLAAGWHWAAWLARLGVSGDGVPPPAGWSPLPVLWEGQGDANPYKAGNAEILAVLRRTGALAAANPSRVTPRVDLIENDAGTLRIDAGQGVMQIDTPRTAGGVLGAGDKSLRSRDGGVRFEKQNDPAVLWVSSLDGKPLRESRRLLVTHLTDVQNTGTRYGETARKTLLDWGGLPLLMRAGSAAVELRLDRAAAFKVYALSPGGRRLAEVRTATDREGILRFAADVAGGGPGAPARMLYEVVREK